MKYREALQLYQALASEIRLEIICLLSAAGCDGLRSGDVARELGVDPTSASYQLGILRRSGLVLQRKVDLRKSYILHPEFEDLYHNSFSSITNGDAR